jgi:signal transduction histidine kinase
MANEPLVDQLLLSNFVHQIISPLNGIVGTISNLKDGTIAHPERKQQRLAAVQAQLQHAIELIRNLAFLSELSSDKGDIGVRQKAADVVLPRLIIEAAQFYQEEASDRNVKISLLDNKTQFVVKGHPDLLKQVFVNLFDNAFKYSDPDTLVAVSAHVQKRSGELLVDVTSEGCPLEYGEIGKIFELGYRGRAAQEVKASGSGLGLYICRRILELAHDATIEALYSPGSRKTTFRIRFLEHKLGDKHEGTFGEYKDTYRG